MTRGGAHEVLGASPRAETLDVFVALLSEVDEPAARGDFYNRICKGVCQLSSMERVILFLYDDALARVRAAGSHGLDPAWVADLHGTLDETPMAQRALAEDRVIEISGGLEGEVPARYARLVPITTLTCTPVSAGGRAFGVIFADRGGGVFELTADESHAMWTLGKVAALAASARIATREQERLRGLGDRLALTREIHERVIQRLFGVSLVLGSEQALSDSERVRARDEVAAALRELRSALRRPLAPASRETAARLRDELERLAASDRRPPLTLHWEDGVEVAAALEPLAQSVVREALRNVEKHARATAIEVHVGASAGALTVEVVNDGADGSPRPGADRARSGMGLRIAGFEALQQGGVVEFGALAGGRWRVRLAVPLEAR